MSLSDGIYKASERWNFGVVAKLGRLILKGLLKLPSLGWILSVGALLVTLSVVVAGLSSTVQKGTYQIRQMVVSGTMDAKMDPGMWVRLFSDIGTWPKAETFFFTQDLEGGDERDQSIEVRFNDGSLADVSGTVRIILPAAACQSPRYIPHPVTKVIPPFWETSSSRLSLVLLVLVGKTFPNQFPPWKFESPSGPSTSVVLAAGLATD